MNTPIGHARVLRALTEHLPPVTLLCGPPSVGKWTIAEHLAQHHHVSAVDRSTWPTGLTAAAARTIIAFVSTAPFGRFKLVTVRLDGSSNTALNAMLKTLEEPPPSARFLLTTSTPTLPTITSRATIYRLGALSVPELTDVLTRHGLRPEAAARAAVLGRGQVRTALAAETSDAARAAVLNLMRAVATTDHELFDRTLRSWDDAAGQLLTQWFTETVTGRWSIFTQADTFGLHTDQARVRKMLTAISRVANARSRLAVRAALETYLTRPN